MRLTCRDVAKSFGGVRALKGVGLDVQAGRVHGLVGENGAGKSTLLKILAGLYRPDQGAVELDGQVVQLDGADDALRRGIVTVHQDINLIGTLTVADNLFLNNEPTVRGGFLRRSEILRRARELLGAYGVEIDPRAPVASLPNDLKKLIQIIKATTWSARVLLLDEPTSSLTDVEVRLVLGLVRRLADEGKGVVFVSHYLAEVFEVCDDITVFRDGAVVASGSRIQTDLPSVVRAMVGRAVDASPPRRAASGTRDVLLAVRGLSARAGLRDVSFDLHAGEVLGVTGLTGSGLNELARALVGAEGIGRTAGGFAVAGAPVALRSPREALAAGIALITNDRLREGILPAFSLTDNVCLPRLAQFADGFALLSARRMTQAGADAIARLRIRAAGPGSAARALSGGNQQKLLFAKWLATMPRIFVMDEPTIGIDVGAKAEIRDIITRIAADGVGVLLITAELAEIESLCDRVLVMFRGAVVAQFAGEEINREAVLHASVSGLAIAA